MKAYLFIPCLLLSFNTLFCCNKCVEFIDDHDKNRQLISAILAESESEFKQELFKLESQEQIGISNQIRGVLTNLNASAALALLSEHQSCAEIQKEKALENIDDPFGISCIEYISNGKIGYISDLQKEIKNNHPIRFWLYEFRQKNER